MELSKWLALYLEKNKCINHRINGWRFQSYAKLAELTELIDYRCQFDRRGICKVYAAEERFYEGGKQNRCCCHTCAGTIGYLQVIPNRPYIIQKYAKLFDGEKGYWRKNEGCILPRSMRSKTCLRYSCKEKEYITETEIQLMRALLHRDEVVDSRWQSSKDKTYFSSEESFITYIGAALREKKSNERTIAYAKKKADSPRKCAAC